ncbi:hypothetical protein DPMN_052747 [Dreissena polymorpha]|uniref:Uncharacterized protein n=1 Tax=Dreissena polymorpha TaxID=45954 RepID=A0A9D4CKY9_DREPO|nr:hypothetical protein DPMN_052747 [Dreissena polymorpha]
MHDFDFVKRTSVNSQDPLRVLRDTRGVVHFESIDPVTWDAIILRDHSYVNSRKRGSGADIGGGINFDGKMYRSRSPDFDSHWEYIVRQEEEQALTNLSPPQDVFVSPEMVEPSINQLPKGKACGPD